MDPLSITAGVAGLLSLSIQINQILQQYVSSVRHAPSEAQDIGAELDGLVRVLEKLETFLKEQNNLQADRFKDSSLLLSSVKACHGQLSTMQRKLVEYMDCTTAIQSKLFQRCKWPFKKAEHQQTVDTIRHCSQVFHLSLSIDGWSLFVKSADQNSEDNKQVKELTTWLKNASLQTSSAIGDLQKGQAAILQGQAQLLQGRSDDRRQTILTWLCTTDTSINYDKALNLRQPNTGKWFLDSQEFSSWMNSPGLMWAYGFAGCGKSILCSTIIEAVKEICYKTRLQMPAYFYCDFQDEEKQDVRILARSLIRQLCATENHIPDAVQTLYDNSINSGHSPTLKELMLLIRSVLRLKKEDVYIIIDALDEIPEFGTHTRRQHALDLVNLLVKEPIPNVHVLVTSRDCVDICDSLAASTAYQVHLSGRSVDLDILAFVRSALQGSKLRILPADLQSDIAERVGEGAQGMFRWAFCQIKMIERCRKLRDIKAALQNLPKTLDETYNRIIASIDETDQMDAQNILRWLIGSKRPLTLEELAEGAIMQHDGKPIDSDDRLTSAFEVLRICQGLVSAVDERLSDVHFASSEDPRIRPSEVLVRFAHFSVQEFLVSKRSTFQISAPSANTHLASCCVSYFLQFDGQDSHHRVDFNDFPLFSYAVDKWVDHVRHANEGSDDDTLQDLLSRLFSPNFRATFALRRRVFRHDYYTGYRSNNPATELPARPLFYSAAFGFDYMSRKLIERGEDLNAVVAEYEDCTTAMQAAAIGGHLSTVELFLRAGADPNNRTHNFLSRILYGSLPDTNTISIRAHILLTLMKNGMEFDHDGHNRAAEVLLHASAWGQIDLLRELLSRGVSPNARFPPDRPTALQFAVAEGRVDAVRFLLDQGAAVDAAGGGWIASALQEAILSHNQVILDMLLKNGAMEHTLIHGKSAIQTAVLSGNLDGLKKLIDFGADVNAGTNQGFTIGTPLLIALERLGKASKPADVRLFEEIIKLLLCKGANPALSADLIHWDDRIAGEHFQTLENGRFLQIKKDCRPLDIAVASRKPEIVGQLLHHGDGISEGLSTTPALKGAIRNADYETVEILLNAEADPNERLTTMSTVSLEWYSSTLRYLISHWLDADLIEFLIGVSTSASRVCSDNCAFHLVVDGGTCGKEEILFDSGVDLSVPDMGRPHQVQSLKQLLRPWYKKNIRKLLKSGADAYLAPCSKAPLTVLEGAIFQLRVLDATQRTIHQAMTQIIDLLLRNGSQITAIAMLWAEGNEAMLELLAQSRQVQSSKENRSQ